MKYIVAYYDRYPLDPKERYDIHRETVNAETKKEAGDIMAYCGKEVIEVTEAEQQADEIKRDAEWLGDFPAIDAGTLLDTSAAIVQSMELDDMEQDWHKQVTELRGGL